MGAFVISNTLSAMPYLITISLISGTICYFMVHFHPGFSHYAFFVLCLYASVTVVESLMMVLASIIPNFLIGITLGSGIQVRRRLHFSQTRSSISQLCSIRYYDHGITTIMCILGWLPLKLRLLTRFAN